MLSADAIVRAIECEFDVASPHPGRVSDFCNQLRGSLQTSDCAEYLKRLSRLVPLLQKSASEGATLLFDFLATQVSVVPRPWDLLHGMLEARSPLLVTQTLALAQQLAEAGRLTIDRPALEALAARACVWEQDAPGRERLSLIGKLLEEAYPRESTGFEDTQLTWLKRDRHLSVRCLAARLLDLQCQTVSEVTARSVLGDDAFSFLAPYLSFTQATHSDLLCIDRPKAELRALIGSFRQAESVCGTKLLREVIGDLGWARVGLGLAVEPLISVRIGDSLPFLVRPGEHCLFDECPGVRPSSRYHAFIAHGQLGPGGSTDKREADQIARFRAHNLAHAEVLIDILDDAPLSPEVARRILVRMDGIVEAFVALFSTIWADTAILPAVYAGLRGQVTASLDAEPEAPFVSAEVSRLVRTFEDPKSLGEVRTLHGLKRFLHQTGLRLGLKLAGGRATNRSVDIVLIDDHERRTVRGVKYADFEAEEESAGELPAIPPPVRLIVDSYLRQILYGWQDIPRTDIYCYGNEVHYYLTFRHHPAFLRVDFSPPLYGGMIDLEYYGVSKYDLADHPNIALDHLQRFLCALDLDVAIDNTRVHARYDKERALRLGDVRSTASALFCLIPYLMDLDWIIGSLSLSAEERGIVAGAWIERFAHWRTLPLRWILSDDRQNIVVGAMPSPSGPRDVHWTGGRCYLDRFDRVSIDTVAGSIDNQLERLGLMKEREVAAGANGEFGQIDLESIALEPLRRAVARSQLRHDGDALEPQPDTLYQVFAPPVHFAGLLRKDHDAIAAAAGTASIISQLEHLLPFTTTGHVNGHEVQQAPLELVGSDLLVYVLRDKSGIGRLAVYTDHGSLCRTRDHQRGRWRELASTDGPVLARLLRQSNYPVATDRGTAPDPGGSNAIVEQFASPMPTRSDGGSAMRRVISGVGAAPGRAFGRALFRLDGREPTDFRDAILVSPAVSPEDSQYLYHARGVVSTGGGVLSHAGLLAAQFRKPAMIIPGRWEKDTDGKVALVYTCQEFTEHQTRLHGYSVGVREQIRTREHRLRDGDLICIDAEQRTVTVLGQEPDTVSLCDCLRRLGDITGSLSQATDVRQVLALRGHRLQIRHQFEHVVERLTDPVVAEHAIAEILLTDALSTGPAAASERALLIELFLRNPGLHNETERVLQAVYHDSRARCCAAREAAQRVLPGSNSLHEILSLRLRAVQMTETFRDLSALLESCEIAVAGNEPWEADNVDSLAWQSLVRLRQGASDECRSLPDDSPSLRHRARLVNQLSALLGKDSEKGREQLDIAGRIALRDAEVRHRLEPNWIVWPGSAGYESAPLIGWKAANLAEIGRLEHPGIVPSWFAVTEAARQLMLMQPIRYQDEWIGPAQASRPTMGEAIRELEANSTLSEREKSRHIGALWESIKIPAELQQALLDALHQLVHLCAVDVGENQQPSFVAIRSSTCEEDAENASRAGEFDTFLFVTGDDLFLSRLRTAWAGFWTERALVSRAVLGIGPEDVRGGLVVQTMIRSRVSGVLQTVNVAQGNLDEIIVNATLGIGEGVVSGVTAADHVVIEKRTVTRDGALTFRYLTYDKTEQVVFDQLSGSGTHRVPSLFHRRLRPALEYTELHELVSVAARLESAYGYPIDMEFAFDDHALWILQVRPVASFVAALQESLSHFPLQAPDRTAVMATKERSMARD